MDVFSWNDTLWRLFNSVLFSNDKTFRAFLFYVTIILVVLFCILFVYFLNTEIWIFFPNDNISEFYSIFLIYIMEILDFLFQILSFQRGFPSILFSNDKNERHFFSPEKIRIEKKFLPYFNFQTDTEKFSILFSFIYSVL